jgi:hypothetical protein
MTSNDNYFNFVPQYTMGLLTNTINVTRKGKVVGYIEAKNVPLFWNGNTTVFEPIEGWRTGFSVQLQERLGLR